MERIARSVHRSIAEVTFDIDGGSLPGIITLPRPASGTVVFAHDSGSDRMNPRDQALAKVLNDYGVATLLIDLITGTERRYEYSARHVHFDVDVQSERLVDAVDWIASESELAGLPVGVLGASTGAAVALRAAAARPGKIAAVVCRGGRPELAKTALQRVVAPTLFVVGSADDSVLQFNRRSAAELQCPHRIQVVQGASHLFDEPGKLDEVARLAREWFLRYFGIALH